MIEPLAAALTVVVGSLFGALALRTARLVDGVSGAASRVPILGGVAPETHAWSRFHVRYYAMALLFLAFDMEMVFMYPWARVFVEEGGVALVEMMMFITILVLGVLYAWRERALRWS